MGRKAKLPRHIYPRGRALYGWYYGPDGKTKIKRSTGCTDPVAAAAKLAEWERDATDPASASRRSAKLGQAFDLLDEDRAALIAQGKRSENSTEFYEMARRVWCRYAGRLIERVDQPDDTLDADRLEELWKLGERAALSTVGVGFVDGFVAYRRAHGLSESTIAKNRGEMRSALALAKRAGIWTGDLETMFPPGFKTGYKPRRVRIAHDDARRLLAYFDPLPHHRAQIAFALATGAEKSAILRAHRTDLDATPIPLHGTKTDDRERACFRVLPWQETYLKIAKIGLDGKKGLAFALWRNSTRDLAAACDELELPRLSLHSLRHIFGAWALDDGIDPHLLAMALGHRDTRMVMRTYDARDAAGIQRRAVEQAQQRAQLRVIEGGKSPRSKKNASR